MSGEILLSHMRSIDIRARPMRYAGAAVPTDILQLVRAKLGGLLMI